MQILGKIVSFQMSRPTERELPVLPPDLQRIYDRISVGQRLSIDRQARRAADDAYAQGMDDTAELEDVMLQVMAPLLRTAAVSMSARDLYRPVPKRIASQIDAKYEQKNPSMQMAYDMKGVPPPGITNLPPLPTRQPYPGEPGSRFVIAGKSLYPRPTTAPPSRAYVWDGKNQKWVLNRQREAALRAGWVPGQRGSQYMNPKPPASERPPLSAAQQANVARLRAVMADARSNYVKGSGKVAWQAAVKSAWSRVANPATVAARFQKKEFANQRRLHFPRYYAYLEEKKARKGARQVARTARAR